MHIDDRSDKELVSAYLKGNESAFEVLLKRHQERIYNQIYGLVRDSAEADDIFQETFVKVVRTLKSGRYNEEGKFLPWVMRIAHNLSIDHFRKGKKMPKVRSDERYDPFASIPRDELNIEEDLIKAVIDEKIRDIILELPKEQQEVIMLRHYAGMSFKDIADQCDVSINTSLGRMRYALINMRKIIAEKNIVLTK